MGPQKDQRKSSGDMHHEWVRAAAQVLNAVLICWDGRKKGLEWAFAAGPW